MDEKLRGAPIVVLDEPGGGVRAVIHPPRRAGGKGDWYCAVQCPLSFKQPKRVYGETPERAEEIAWSFVRARLEPSEEVEKSG